MAHMADSETNLGTGGRGEDRKQTPEETAEDLIEWAWNSKATQLNFGHLGRTELPASIGRLDALGRGAGGGGVAGAGIGAGSWYWQASVGGLPPDAWIAAKMKRGVLTTQNSVTRCNDCHASRLGGRRGAGSSESRGCARFMGNSIGLASMHGTLEPAIPLTRPVGHPLPSPLDRSGDRGLGRGEWGRRG
jgi:hypothetical protein